MQVRYAAILLDLQEHDEMKAGRTLSMTRYNTRYILMTMLVLSAIFFLVGPVQAFTANSLDITIDKNGDATAVFRFTLEGLIENAIPQSILEEQLVKGLSGGSEPPTLVTMDRSSATLILKKFANTYDVAEGTDYQTSTMDFKKAEIALQNSAVSSVITADFSPTTATLIFSDGYVRTFTNIDSLPSITHTIIDPVKAAKAKAANTAAPTAVTPGLTTAVPNGGTINVTSTPDGAEVLLDGTSIGNAPGVFTGIPAGRHTLTFQKAGHTPVTKEITMTNGKTIKLSVYLAAAEPTPTKTPLGGLVAVAAIAACITLLFIRRK